MFYLFLRSGLNSDILKVFFVRCSLKAPLLSLLNVIGIVI